MNICTHSNYINVCVLQGLLTIVNGTSKPVQLRGTFSGTWDAEIHCDKANIHNLFEQQRKDKENRVSTM